MSVGGEVQARVAAGPQQEASETGPVSTDWDDVVSRPLPPGVHPRDPSEEVHLDFGTNYPAPRDRPPSSAPATGRKPWHTDNTEAIPVFERGSLEGKVRIVQANAQAQGGVVIACMRTRGRKSVTLAVPPQLGDGTAVTQGVIWGFSEDGVQTASSSNVGEFGVLGVGDSVTIATEARIWVAPIVGQPLGYVQVIEEINPPGGNPRGE